MKEKSYKGKRKGNGGGSSVCRHLKLARTVSSSPETKFKIEPPICTLTSFSPEQNIMHEYSNIGNNGYHHTSYGNGIQKALSSLKYDQSQYAMAQNVLYSNIQLIPGKGWIVNKQKVRNGLQSKNLQSYIKQQQMILIN